jgi:hypothetical protein
MPHFGGPKDEGDEHSADAAIAIVEGMDGLEIRIELACPEYRARTATPMPVWIS